MIEAYCTFCRVKLIPEDDHMMCPECLGRYSLTVSSMPYYIKEQNPNCDACYGEKTEDCPDNCLTSHIRFSCQSMNSLEIRGNTNKDE